MPKRRSSISSAGSWSCWISTSSKSTQTRSRCSFCFRSWTSSGSPRPPSFPAKPAIGSGRTSSYAKPPAACLTARTQRRSSNCFEPSTCKPAWMDRTRIAVPAAEPACCLSKSSWLKTGKTYVGSSPSTARLTNGSCWTRNRR